MKMFAGTLLKEPLRNYYSRGGGFWGGGATKFGENKEGAFRYLENLEEIWFKPKVKHSFVTKILRKNIYIYIYIYIQCTTPLPSIMSSAQSLNMLNKGKPLFVGGRTTWTMFGENWKKMLCKKQLNRNLLQQIT